MHPDGHLRRLLTIVVALAAAVASIAGLGAGAAAAAVLPPEGIFENCNLDIEMATCVQRLQVMHQGGMEVVVIPADDGSPSSDATYAATAQSFGMSVMWELASELWWRDPWTSTGMVGQFPGYAAACGCTEDGPLLDYVVHWLAGLPGTYGYYAVDDTMIAPGDQTGVSAYMQRIRQQDPSHTLMIGAADETQAQQYQSMADTIGTEIYPITTSSVMPVAANQDTWGSVAQWAKDTQQMANGAGKQSAFILQAFTWGDNLADGQAIGACSTSDSQLSCYQKLRYPSSAEQLQLRNEILLNAHPRLILWWSFPGTFGQAVGDTYSIYPTGAQAAARWNGLASAVQAPFPTSPTIKPGVTPGQPVRAHIASGSVKAASHRRHRRHRHRRHHKRHRRRHQHRRHNARV